jgi:CheY-like chemotaxis protein
MRRPLWREMSGTVPHGARVLVVDDEPQVVWVLQFSLESEGFETFAAHDGREALAQVKRHHPNLMVLDVMMPRMDGWSVLEQLRDLPLEERPRVVMLTALASVQERSKAAALGADAFLVKPFDVEDLITVLHGLEVAS